MVRFIVILVLAILVGLGIAHGLRSCTKTAFSAAKADYNQTIDKDAE